MDSITKKCNVCENIKPIKDFYMAGKWLSYRCKECTKISVKKWVQSNPEKRKVIANRYARNNKDTLKKWRANHPQNVVEFGKRYYSKNKEKIRSSIREWFRRNPEKTSEYKRNRRARLEGNGGRITAKEWKEVVLKYGNKCLCCGSENVKLTMDHVVPLVQGGQHSTDNVQPLCLTCNLKKGTKAIDYRRYI